MVLSSEIEETLYYSIHKNDRKKIIFSNEKILDNLEAVLNANDAMFLLLDDSYEKVQKEILIIENILKEYNLME
jgi:hypothetical protein